MGSHIIEPYPFSHPFERDKDLKCIRRTAGDELDDYVIYTSVKCGRIRKAGKPEDDKTYVRLVRRKDNGGFYVEIVSELSTRFKTKFNTIRFMSGDSRQEFSTIRFFVYENCRNSRCRYLALYFSIVPWNAISKIDGDLKIRYYGKFRRDAKLHYSNLKPFQVMVEKKKFTEIKKRKEKEELQKKIRPNLFHA